MKKERILKTIVVLLIGVVLFAMSSNVFAADVQFWEDTTNQLDTNTNTNTNTSTNTNTNTNTNMNTNTANSVDTTNTETNNYNTNLPKAGTSENKILGIGIVILAILAIYTYKKINQYKNI